MRRALALALLLNVAVLGCSRSTPTPEPKSSPDPAMQTKAGYDPTRDPTKDLALLVTRARAENKRILLVVGGEWCIWCHYLHNFIDKDPEIKASWEGKFLTLLVNYSEENKNEGFLSRYPKIPGYPHIFVLDKAGALLQSQDTSLLESGRSYSKDAVRAFLDKWSNPS